MRGRGTVGTSSRPPVLESGGIATTDDASDAIRVAPSEHPARSARPHATETTLPVDGVCRLPDRTVPSLALLVVIHAAHDGTVIGLAAPSVDIDTWP